MTPHEDGSLLVIRIMVTVAEANGNVRNVVSKCTSRDKMCYSVFSSPIATGLKSPFCHGP